MTALGIVFICVGVILTALQPRLNLKLSRGKLRGIGGPILIVLGILILTGVI